MKTERQKILETILVMAEHYQRELSKTNLVLIADALEGVTADQVAGALKKHLQGPNGRFFPSPGDLLAIIERRQPVQQAANECVSRVLEAVVKFGYVDPESARTYLGETIWAALPGATGWKDFCLSGEHISQSTARAQLRDRIAARLQQENPTGQVALPPPGKPEFKSLIKFEEAPPGFPEDKALLTDGVQRVLITNIGGADGKQ